MSADMEATGVRVLLVDDQALVAEVVRRILNAVEGASFEYCSESPKALRTAREVEPTVILQDLEMPEIDGFGLLQQYRGDSVLGDVPVIMLTGKEEAETKAKAFALGASDYVVKLPDPVELMARIRHHSAGYNNLRLRRRSEDALRAAEAAARQAAKEADAANAAKSIFLARMSHEIRTPMNAILGYTQILSTEPNLTDKQRKAVETIHSSGEHLLGLINDVLDLAKIEAGREELTPTNFDLPGRLQAIGAMFEVRCQQKGLEWRLETDLANAAVRGDENKLRQVLINLLGNAVKFTVEGEVALRVKSLGEDRYSFEVTDTGPGIPQKSREAIFEPFQQDEAGVRHGGTGLGLSITRSHVELMGGELDLASEVGKGSRFSFSLALPDADAAVAAEPQTVIGLADGRSVQALVVDDIMSNRDVLKQLLERIGVTVDVAESGEEALLMARERKPDIVFMDLHLPGMDGVETRKRLTTEHGADIPVVCVTAAVYSHERGQLKEQGFDAVIMKPLRAEEVYETLPVFVGVEVVYGDKPSASRQTVADPAVWRDLSVPEELATALSDAAERHNVSELNRRIGDLEGLGEAGKQLAEHLLAMSRRFDMEGIRAALEDATSRARNRKSG